MIISSCLSIRGMKDQNSGVGGAGKPEARVRAPRFVSGIVTTDFPEWNSSEREADENEITKWPWNSKLCASGKTLVLRN
jgi:hypothetical protein